MKNNFDDESKNSYKNEIIAGLLFVIAILINLAPYTTYIAIQYNDNLYNIENGNSSYVTFSFPCIIDSNGNYEISSIKDIKFSYYHNPYIYIVFNVFGISCVIISLLYLIFHRDIMNSEKIIVRVCVTSMLLIYLLICGFTVSIMGL